MNVGDKISTIYFSDTERLRLGTELYEAKDIEVVQYPGQMGYVYWARATYNNGDVCEWNLAIVQGVELLIERKESDKCKDEDS